MLANELGLSISTVSKAISDSHEISATTKQKVKVLAEKLNYVPNHFASSLGKRKSKTIAVVIPEVVDSFFALAINGIESIAQKKGYHVSVYLTHESLEKEKMILKDFESGRVDGVLISISRETTCFNHFQNIINKGVPLVFFDRVPDEVDTFKIITNDYEIAYEATQQLIMKDCSKILFLSFSNILSITNNRLEGYKNALLDYKLKVSEKNILYFNNELKSDYLLLKKELKSPKRPDGILASVGKLTIPVYQVCEELKLNIPGDIQVISFSNLDMADFLNPPLSTVEQPAFELGRKAASILVDTLEKKTKHLQPGEIVINSTLVLRRSTKL